MPPFKPAKWHLGLLLVIIGTVLYVTSDQRSRPAGDGFYAGKLADGRSVFIDLLYEKTNVQCTIHLEGTADFCIIDSLLNAKNEIVCVEEWMSDRNINIVRELRGSVSGNPPVFSGKLALSNSPVSLPFSATNIAARELIHYRRGVQIFGYGERRTFDTSRPLFVTKNRFLTDAVQRLEMDADESAKDFNDGVYGEAWEAIKQRGRGSTLNWEAMRNVAVSCYSPRTVSFYVEWWGYTGGAHGNTAISGLNLVDTDAATRYFALPELFRSPTNAEPIIARMCTRELKKQGASAFEQAPAPVLHYGEMSAFTFDGGGIAIHFSPYAAGAYVEGSYHVFIPWKDLRPLLDTNGPARFIPGALADAR